SLVSELLDDAVALQKDGVSPGRIGLALVDRWEAEELGAAGTVKRTRSPSGAIELLFPGGEKIIWNGASWGFVSGGVPARPGRLRDCGRSFCNDDCRWGRRRRNRRRLYRLLGWAARCAYPSDIARRRPRIPRPDRHLHRGSAPPVHTISRHRNG